MYSKYLIDIIRVYSFGKLKRTACVCALNGIFLLEEIDTWENDQQFPKKLICWYQLNMVISRYYNIFSGKH